MTKPISRRMVFMPDGLSLDHPIGPRQHIRRYRKTDLLGGLQIYDQLELSWLLHRKVSGFDAFKDLVHVCSGAPIQVGEIRPIRHEAATLDGAACCPTCRQPVLDREFSNARSEISCRAPNH